MSKTFDLLMGSLDEIDKGLENGGKGLNITTRRY